VSSSRDGSIKLWDAVSNKCVNTFEKAHDGSQVCSVEFSRNGKVKVFIMYINVYKYVYLYKHYIEEFSIIICSTFYHQEKIL